MLQHKSQRLTWSHRDSLKVESSFQWKDVLKMDKQELRKLRGEDIGFVFQDPMTSLNPTMRVGAQIEEVFLGRKGMTKQEKKEKALEIMKLVGISDVEKRYKQYPHELSGGMKQRIMIAIGLVSRPSLVICDEPTTSLDVTIEAQILDLLLELRDKLGISIIMITHDLGVIARMCDRVIVMYGGEIVVKKVLHRKSFTIQLTLIQRDLWVLSQNWILQKDRN